MEKSASGNAQKRRRVGTHHSSAFSTRLSSASARLDSFMDRSYSSESTSLKLRRASSSTSIASVVPKGTTSASFNDPVSADVILRLHIDSSLLDPADDDDEADLSSPSSPRNSDDDDVWVYLHSHILRRAKYFAVSLSDRWNAPVNDGCLNLKLAVSASSMGKYLTVLDLLYADGFDDIIDTASIALDILPIALKLLFDDCIRYCIRFLEAVPWTEEEERRVVSLVPSLREEESRDLLARVSPKENSCEEMLSGLIRSAIHNHPNMAFVKAFVAKLLRDFSSRETARRVLEQAFETSLRVVTESLEEYSSPDFRGDHNDTETMQRLSLHSAMINGKHLLWVVDRMVELRVADSAVEIWSQQAAFTADLQRAFREDAWRNMAPGLPAVVLRCTCKLANAVANGVILAARQVRLKLVKDWLPVLIVCRDNVSPMLPNNKSLYLELEETFLRIISTLPMSEAQELLKHCLSFSTRNVEDCPHLIAAFRNWFRRAARPPQTNNLG